MLWHLPRSRKCWSLQADSVISCRTPEDSSWEWPSSVGESGPECWHCGCFYRKETFCFHPTVFESQSDLYFVFFVGCIINEDSTVWLHTSQKSDETNVCLSGVTDLHLLHSLPPRQADAQHYLCPLSEYFGHYLNPKFPLRKKRESAAPSVPVYKTSSCAAFGGQLVLPIKTLEQLGLLVANKYANSEWKSRKATILMRCE